MKKENLRALDFVMGLMFSGVGIFIMLGAYRMMFLEKNLQFYPIYTNPGTFAIVVGGLLLLMGLNLVIIGFRESGRLKTVAEGLKTSVHNPRLFRGLLVVALLGIYYFGLIGHMPYFWATFVFLTVTMLIFKAGQWWKVLIISSAASLAVTYFFGTVANLPLP